jgi:hypothetical protein
MAFSFRGGTAIRKKKVPVKRLLIRLLRLKSA